MNEEIIASSSTIPQSTSILLEPITPCLLSIAIPNSPSDNRRISIRQQKRRTFRDPSISTKKRTRVELDINSNSNIDTISNSDHSPIPIDQQSVESRRKFVR